MRLKELIEIARLLSSKYTRSKVRKAMPKEYAYILDELIHVQKDEDDNQVVYHQNIVDTILKLNNGDEFIEAFAEQLYPKDDPMEASLKAISVMLFNSHGMRIK